MSQRSNPKSPKSPGSKSPSSDLAEGQEQQPGEENDIQRAVEEELRTLDRAIHEAQNASRASPQSRGASPAQSKPQSSGGSRSASVRARTAYEEETPQLPSPPQSPVTYGSRVGSTGQRGQTPECSRPGSKIKSDHEAVSASSKPFSKMYSTTGSMKANKSGMGYQLGSERNFDGEVVETSNSMSPAYTLGGVGCSSNRGPSGINFAASSGKIGNCYPGCKKYRRGPGEPLEASEAPSFGVRANEQSSARGFEDRKRPCGFLERTEGGSPAREGPPPYSSPRQPRHKHQTALSSSPGYDKAYQSPGHAHNAPMKPPQAVRGSERPMSAGIGAQASSHHHHHEGHEDINEIDERAVSALAHLSQLRKTPSYVQCGLNQGLEFLNVCCQSKSDKKRERITSLPQKPCLRQEQIQELINCETQDVESAWYLTSDERKSYKKPCPKQQKAKMTVKAIVQAHTQAKSCSDKEYFPLEHPDPEDISPEVAAAMMFSQERGIKMEECPYDTIASLFPDEPKPPFPEKLSQNRLSVVDRSSKDQEEMIEKSASVPSEGVSDSAYTRRMKGKGEDMGPQKSFDVDFAIGQSKREYVLVAQTPQRINKVQYRGGNSPPWFPGYFTAFPNEEGIKIVTSPSNILNSAWMHSNPKNVPTTDVIVLD